MTVIRVQTGWNIRGPLLAILTRHLLGDIKGANERNRLELYNIITQYLVEFFNKLPVFAFKKYYKIQNITWQRMVTIFLFVYFIFCFWRNPNMDMPTALKIFSKCSPFQSILGFWIINFFLIFSFLPTIFVYYDDSFIITI